MSSSKAASTMNDLEWASVSKYLHWLEVQAKLMPFCISAVYSFRVSDGGFEGLVGQKSRLLQLLQGNLLNLQEWVKRNDDRLTENERVFARSLWSSTAQQIEIVAEHRHRALKLSLSQASFEFPSETTEVIEDELPF